MPLVGVAKGRAEGTWAGQQAGGSASISCRPSAGMGRGLGWHQKAWVSCSCPTYSFEALSGFQCRPLCLSQGLTAGRHKAKGK